MQFLFQSLFHNGRQILSIYFMCSVVTDSCQNLITVRNNRCTFIRSDRRNTVTHFHNFSCIGDADFLRLISPEIIKFFEHLLRRTQIKRRRCLIIKSSSCLNDLPVDLILRVQEMYITGCHNRFMELFSKYADAAIDISDIIIGMNVIISIRIHHEMIISNRLYFKIIIEIHQPRNFLLRPVFHNRTIQFSRATGTSDNQTFPVFQQFTLGN